MRRGIGRMGRPSLIGTAARTAVVVGTASAVAGGMSNKKQAQAQTEAEAAAYRQQQEQAAIDAQVAAQVQAQMAAQQPAAPPPPPPAAAPAAGGDDTIAQLQKLAELKAQGILSDDEFAAAKAKLLGL